MTKISCSAITCLYNNYELCSAATIEIEGENAKHSKGTFCNTYSGDDLEEVVEGVLNTNYIGEVKQMFNRNEDIIMNPKILCQALNCIYNHERKCSAGNIYINGEDATAKVGTKCETFRPKE